MARWSATREARAWSARCAANQRVARALEWSPRPAPRAAPPRGRAPWDGPAARTQGRKNGDQTEDSTHRAPASCTGHLRRTFKASHVEIHCRHSRACRHLRRKGRNLAMPVAALRERLLQHGPRLRRLHRRLSARPRHPGRINGAQAVKLGPDGLLYVTSEMSQQILRYRNDTLEFVDVFATIPGIDPTGLRVRPERRRLRRRRSGPTRCGGCRRRRAHRHAGAGARPASTARTTASRSGPTAISTSRATTRATSIRYDPRTGTTAWPSRVDAGPVPHARPAGRPQRRRHVHHRRRVGSAAAPRPRDGCGQRCSTTSWRSPRGSTTRPTASC